MTPGVACDLSHINTGAKVSYLLLKSALCFQVTGFTGADQLEASMAGADLVIVPAGVPRKPGIFILPCYVYRILRHDT